MGNFCGTLATAGPDAYESGWQSLAGVVNVVEAPSVAPLPRQTALASSERSVSGQKAAAVPESDRATPRVLVPVSEDGDTFLQQPTTPTALPRTERFAAGAPVSWTRGELIGAGAFGRVYLGLNNDTGHLMAVKQVLLSKDEGVAGRVAEHVRDLEMEVNLLKQLDHPNIVRYLGTDRTHEHLNIFLEFVPGGSIASLLSKFGSFKETVIKLYTRQILSGLEYLHAHQIMHRDVKGANILVDNTGLVKLADFGASKQIENLVTIDSGHKSIKGTPYWMAPEVIKQTGHGRQADIWSVGCTVIEMATGKPPWSQFSSQVSALFHIASSKGPPPIPEALSPECKDFLLLCFNRVPKDRPNATRLLKHPFLADTPPRSLGAALTAMAAVDQPQSRLLKLATAVPSPIKEEPELPLTPLPAARAAGPPQEAWESSQAGLAGPRAASPRAGHSPPAGQSGARPGHSGLLPRSESECSSDSASPSAGSDYNPVEEPSWLQSDSLTPHNKRKVADTTRSLPFQEHSINVTAAANIPLATTKVLSPRPQSPVSKQQQWQAELERELAEQRSEARLNLARDHWPAGRS
ncbi:hypothetical protein WJX72_004880 [[Myrmecia] bisecta]|uniref:mitogen-activated protein kinase kinase kinase n=1 Tax=[Myrmecia] bisecta TaxID=41462 RepID=A0AAW1P8V4_9CHLO